MTAQNWGLIMILIAILIVAVIAHDVKQARTMMRLAREQEIDRIASQEAHAARQRYERQRFTTEPRDTEVM